MPRSPCLRLPPQAISGHHARNTRRNTRRLWIAVKSPLHALFGSVVTSKNRGVHRRGSLQAAHGPPTAGYPERVSDGALEGGRVSHRTGGAPRPWGGHQSMCESALVGRGRWDGGGGGALPSATQNNRVESSP